MEICKLSMLEYYIAFAGSHTALSSRFAAQADADNGLYGVRIEGTYAGFICVLDDVNYTRISYALTVPAYRNRGVFTGLVQHILAISEKPVRLSISSSQPFYDVIRHICENLGFLMTEKVTVFSCSRKDKDKWDTFMKQKGKRLCDMLQMHGYRAVSFQDLDKDLLEQIRISDRSEYANMFHPSVYLDDPSRKLSRDLSYAVIREGKVAAYCLVTMGDQTSAVFDQISVSAAEQGRGVILLAYAYSMQRFFERDLARAYYAMYDSNRHANAFRNKILMLFPTTESTMDNYCSYHISAT